MRHLNSLSLLFATIVAPGISQAQDIQINIDDAPFTRPLIEALAQEYSKVNPEAHVTITSNPEAASLSLDAEATGESIARYVVLPIANSQSELLKVKKVQRGLNDKLARKVYVEQTYEEQLDAQDYGEKPLPGTVYTLTGKRAHSTRLWAKRLNVSPSSLKGKRILGGEETAIRVVQSHPDAVSLAVANVLYTNNGQPADNITVLDTDLNGDGRVNDAERAAVENIQQLTSYLAATHHTGVPTGSLTIVANTPASQQFASWAASLAGQQIASRFGYLKPENTLVAQK